MTMHANHAAAEPGAPPAPGAQIIALRPPTRLHDPLRLITTAAPSQSGRIVLWSVAGLCTLMVAWAAFGELDVVATAEGKLAPQTLVKIVQPAEAGVVKALLVDEGDHVKAGQVLARLDTTLAHAERSGAATALAAEQMQVRRLEAALADVPMQSVMGDDRVLFSQVQGQDLAQRKAFRQSQEQEQSLLEKARQERAGAVQVLSKLEQTLPSYRNVAASYAKLERDGFVGNLASAEKQRDAVEKARDLDAQAASVAALTATVAAQQMRITQLQSTYRSDRQHELADSRARVAQLQPTLDKSQYKEGLMELRAPQDGVIKDLSTTTVGAVVQPGTVVLTLVPQGELLFADVAIKNEDVGFVREGQKAQIKLATFPFQRHGMLTGTVVHISADATEPAQDAAKKTGASDAASTQSSATYKARVRLDAQSLYDPHGENLVLGAGMQVVAEINQGKRTVLEYLLSPVKKVVGEAARER